MDGALSFLNLDPIFEFHYSGDETLIYRIDTSHPEVQSGLIRIEEATHGCLPIVGAGFRFRNNLGTILDPRQFADIANATLTTRVEGETLILDYEEHFEGSHRKTYKIRAVGKSLEIHAYDRVGNTNGTSNYCGLGLGSVEQVSAPEDLRIPYMISNPVTSFSDTSGQGAFTATLVDWSRSNSSAPPFSSFADVQLTATSVLRDTTIDYAINNSGRINAHVNETLWVIVSDRLEPTFPTTDAAASPYRDLLSGRTTGLFSRKIPWQEQAQLMSNFNDWGMSFMAIYDFWWWSSHIRNSITQLPAHTWTPAYDEAEFFPYIQNAKDAGILFGGYTLYSISPSQAFHDPSDAVLNWAGETLSRISPTRAIAHSLREDTAMRSLYGTSLAFTDVWGLEHPAVVCDHDSAEPDKVKTTSSTLIEKRRFFRQQQEIHQGPCLSEGSGAIMSASKQFEWLNAGYLDSNQASINTGAEIPVKQLDPASPSTPANWWVIPDFALRVLAPKVVDHGNGFYDRFFVAPQTPLNDELLDKYRIYEITYGHSSFFQTTGPVNGVEPGELNNRLYYADHIKEYYLMQALQREYLGSEIESILYWADGAYQELSSVVSHSTSLEGPLENLRDPRIWLKYKNGLHIYLNHSPEPWGPLTIADGEYLLPEDGWVAVNSGTGLLALSAIPISPEASIPGVRIDYCQAPNWYELLDGRGQVNRYREVDSPGGLGLLQVNNHVRNLALTENLDNSIQVDQGVLPQLERMDLQGHNLYPVGGRSRIRVDARYFNGARAEWPHLLGEWLSSDPTVAIVNTAGVVTGLLPGEVQISFVSATGVSASLDVTVF